MMHNRTLTLSGLAVTAALLAGPALAQQPVPAPLPPLVLDPVVMQHAENPCALDKHMHATILSENAADKKARVRIVSDAGAAANAPHLKVTMQHSRQQEVGTDKNPIWMEARAVVQEQGKTVAEYGFLTEDNEGRIQDCKVAKGLAEQVADDIASWARNVHSGVKVAQVIPVRTKEPLNESVQNNCPFDRQLSAKMADEKAGIYRVTESIDQASGKKLLMAITSARLVAGALYSGGKWVKVEGRLVENGKELGNFIAMRHSVRDWTSCGVAERLAEELGEDFQKWVQNPGFGSKLGDADAQTQGE